jgi:hypothetical protein
LPAGRTNGAGNVGDLGPATGHQRHVGPHLGQCSRGRQSDATTRTGDQGSASVKTHGGQAGQSHTACSRQ